MDQPRLLIVEDDSDLAEMLEGYFRTIDYEVATAGSGAEALTLAQQGSYSLIMLDIRLPDISGYDICRQLRTQRRTQETPILFLTEKRDRIDKLQGLELGVVDYITKPFDIHELRLRVRNALQRAQTQAHNHRVTDLPHGAWVDERLNVVTYGAAPWGIAGFALTGLDRFREQYGFVAADDVLRAVAMMMRNALREFKRDEDFIGHLTQESFVIVTTPEMAREMRDRVVMKMLVSREFFYPLRDREDDAGELRLAEAEMINLASHVLTSEEGMTEGADAVRKALAEGLGTAER
jgi:PleD family two-component response regulator